MRSLIELGVRTSKERIEEFREEYAEWAAKHNKENAKGISLPVDGESSSKGCDSSESHVSYVSHVLRVVPEAPPIELLQYFVML